MSSASQPHNKKQRPVSGNSTKSSGRTECGHSNPQATCLICRSNQKKSSSNSDDKTRITEVISLIGDLLKKDPKAIEKAAKVVSLWVKPRRETKSDQKKLLSYISITSISNSVLWLGRCGTYYCHANGS